MGRGAEKRSQPRFASQCWSTPPGASLAHSMVPALPWLPAALSAGALPLPAATSDCNERPGGFVRAEGAVEAAMEDVMAGIAADARSDGFRRV